jgi:hypothetical protein
MPEINTVIFALKDNDIEKFTTDSGLSDRRGDDLWLKHLSETIFENRKTSLIFIKHNVQHFDHEPRFIKLVP